MRPLLCGMEHNLIMAAVVEGTSPGRIWADHADSPRTVLMSTPEGHFVAGECPAGAAARSLRELIQGDILPRGRKAGWEHFCLHYPRSGWDEAIVGVLDGVPGVWDYQQYFVLKELQLDWREGLPEGPAMTRVDERLLGERDLGNIDRLRGWARGSFGSIAGFQEHGFGFCIVHRDEIVSWCMSDCVSAPRCEVGVHTDERYRRQSLAKRAVAAAMEHCLETGLTHIGWHCWSANAASAATARAAGFEKVLNLPGVNVYLTESRG